jgi:uncharacterized Zn-binding protein involved in type VI secretion
MGMPAAKKDDTITAKDVHLIQPPGTAPPASVQHPFKGKIEGKLSTNVNIMGKPAATVKSTATNTPAHQPIGGTFVIAPGPANRGTIIAGSATVFINGKPAARSGDTAITCNDPVDLPVGTVVAKGSVFIG